LICTSSTRISQKAVFKIIQKQS